MSYYPNGKKLKDFIIPIVIVGIMILIFTLIMIYNNG